MTTEQKTLSLDQRKHVKMRVAETLSRKLDDLKRKHTAPGKEPTEAQKLKAMREEFRYTDFPMKSSARMSTALLDAFDFSSLESEEVFNSDAFEKEAVVLRALAGKINDMAVLGDGNQAFALLQTFANE